MRPLRSLCINAADSDTAREAGVAKCSVVTVVTGAAPAATSAATAETGPRPLLRRDCRDCRRRDRRDVRDDAFSRDRSSICLRGDFEVADLP